ncbi:MAG: cell division protein SepF [Oscillospiraceae bacterium]|nr:cell division protein SepF [Oscillospiraceae bacterium]
MKFSDKMKKAFGLDSDYFDIDEENEEEEEDSYEPERIPARRQSSADRIERRASSGVSRTPTKVVDIHTTAKLQVVLKKPEHFSEATSIADELLEKRTVVLNLEATAKDEAGKLLSFLSGVAYSNGGQLKKIANNTYIITPYNVDVMGDLLDELENNGMFFV